MTEHAETAGTRLPILGPLSPIGRGAIVLTVLTSIVAIVPRLRAARGPDDRLHRRRDRDPGPGLGRRPLDGASRRLTGPQVGGILNATFGNIAELIIAFFALQAGLIEVVKASLTGSIIGNLLLVMGASVLIGGLRHGTQKFDPKIAGANAALLLLALVGLFVPAVFALHDERSDAGHAHRGVGLRRPRPDGGLRARRSSTSSRTPATPSVVTASRQDTPGRPGAAGRDRRPAGGCGVAGGALGDPGRGHRAVHRDVRAQLRSSSASS